MMDTNDLHGATLSAHHDGHGWLIRAERAGDDPFLFGAYAADPRTAYWTAKQVAARLVGCKVAPLWLQ